jgi:medium-chain acyl-[acyl-carrier-protein] hydrolase
MTRSETNPPPAGQGTLSPAEPHEAEYRVRVYEADHTGCLTPISLFNYLQETAGAAAAARSRGRIDLRARGLAWFLNRFHFRIARYPRIGELVRVRTWPHRMEKHASIREFEVLDGTGALFAAATSQWVLINLVQRRLTRVPDWLRESYPVHDRRMLDDPFTRIPAPEAPDLELRFHVRISDLDVNQHANSASYIDWCLEAVPEDTHRRFVPSDFEINYLREAGVREGLTVHSERILDTGEAPGFLHIIRRDADGEKLAVARSRWVPPVGVVVSHGDAPDNE